MIQKQQLPVTIY